MKKMRQQDAGRQLLLVLVVAVVVVSLVGTWLVLQNGFESPTTSRTGTLSFTKPASPTAFAQPTHPVDAGEVVFTKR